jgi:hypothetical protein
VAVVDTDRGRSVGPCAAVRPPPLPNTIAIAISKAAVWEDHKSARVINGPMANEYGWELVVQTWNQTRLT